jgi:hypothetical protein
MIKIIVVLLVTLYLNIPAQTESPDSTKSQSEYQNRAENIKGVNHYSYSDKPVFPPENQIKDIKGKREVHSRTKIKLYFGLANTSRSSTDMNESFANMESSYGIHNVNTFDYVYNSFTMGVRLGLFKNFSVMWEYLYGGKPDFNQYTLSSTSLSAMFSPYPDGVLSPSIGIGIATQKIKARRIYDYYLSSDGAYLDKIEFDSGPTWGVPLIALLDINPFRGNTGFSLFASARYVFGPSPTVVQQLERASSASSVTIDMNNARFTAGISVGL